MTQKQQLQSWSVVGLMADITVAFMFLCFITALPNAIFFPALVAMGFSGLEVMLGIEVLSFLLGFEFVYKLSYRFSGFFVMLSLPAFYLFWDTPDHLMRGAYIGLSLVLLRFVVHSVLTSTQARATRMSWAWGIASLFLICLRFANKSANPIWTFEGQDKCMAFIGLLASLYLLYENAFSPAHDPKNCIKLTGYCKWILPALAFGSLQFLSTWLYSNYNVVCRWVGVDPFLYGPGIILAFYAGFLISNFKNFVRSFFWGVGGGVGGILLYAADPLPGYVGGLLLAAFVSSSWQLIFESILMNSYSKGRLFFLAQLVFIFLEFTTVWNIAYMFLDLGDAFREAPHYPLGFAIFCMALHNFTFSDVVDNDNNDNNDNDNDSKNNTKGEDKRDDSKTKKIQMQLEHKRAQFDYYNKQGSIWLSVLFLCVAGYAAYIRLTPELTITNPHKVENKSNELKVMVWNVHTGYDDYGFNNYVVGTKFIQDMGAGVVAILESDQARIVTGNRDQIEYFGASLGFPYHNYGVQTRESTWGCAMLSLYPIKWSKVTILPSPEGTRSCLIDSIIEIQGKEFGIIVSHFSTEEFPEDLRLQSIELAKLASSKTLPTVVLCYITSAPTSHPRHPKHLKANYETILRDGKLKDPDPSDFDRWCQYIFYKHTDCLKFYHVDTGYMSDTEGLLADVRLEAHCKGDAAECKKTEKSIKAEFYKYNIKERTLTHRYTGAK